MRKLFVPDYFLKFRCKCGECRNCCCVGWKVTISYLEYCHLLGFLCKKSMRSKIDAALCVLDKPTEESYALIKRDYLGNCPLRDRTDGKCLLHKECGEMALPAVCRLYPRNILFDALKEGSCANSCEAVLELLYADDNKVKMMTAEMFDSAYFYKSQEKISKNEDNSEEEKAIFLQNKAVEILEDRTKPLAKRFSILGNYLINNGYAPKLISICENKTFAKINVFIDILELCQEALNYSVNFDKYYKVFDNITMPNDFENYTFLYKRYLILKQEFENSFENWQVKLEKTMINHIFYERFPADVVVFSGFSQLCIVYALTKFCLIFYQPKSNNDFVDCVAGLNRCFEHSSLLQLLDAAIKRDNNENINFLSALVNF